MNLNASTFIRLTLFSLILFSLPSWSRSQSAGGDSTVTLTIQQARSISATVSRAFEYADKYDSCRVIVALQDTLLRKTSKVYEDALNTAKKDNASLQRDLTRSERKVRIWKSVSSALAGAAAVMVVLLL